uniref:Putative secreted protein n=1 Tax=Anopheles marajoara TaxID=58244 RepID=A0A2M4CDK8_9DIPT
MRPLCSLVPLVVGRSFRTVIGWRDVLTRTFRSKKGNSNAKFHAGVTSTDREHRLTCWWSRMFRSSIPNPTNQT